MMNRWCKTYSLLAVFFAAILFLGVSIGGEYFHQHLHHHETQTSHDDCIIYQLQAQAVLAGALLCLACRAVFTDDFLKPYAVITRSAYYSLDRGRSPPFSHLV